MICMASLSANAVYSLVEADQWLNSDPDTQIVISQQRLLGRAEELCDLLKYEYIFTPVRNSVHHVCFLELV